MKGTSNAQRIMLFSLFNQACKTKGCKATPELRHEITVAALGGSKSWSDLNNGDVDKIKAHLQTIIDPDYIAARLHKNDPEIQERERIIFGIEHLEEFFGAEYVEKICSNKTRNTISNWHSLSFKSLRLLHITLQNRYRTRKALERVNQTALCPF